MQNDFDEQLRIREKSPGSGCECDPSLINFHPAADGQPVVSSNRGKGELTVNSFTCSYVCS